jgi:hypothetical protein
MAEMKEHASLYDGKRWGGWEFKQNYALRFYGTYPSESKDVKPRLFYEIDLEEIHSSAEMLDWIMQIIYAAWATTDCIADLCRAFYEIFDPQASLCGWGGNGRIDDVVKHVEKIYADRQASLADVELIEFGKPGQA